ncbi:MAG: hypothetical protein LBC76_08175 [Treponema sp.]|nr:hypothetical protein [Treponema sp.]
MNYRTEIYFKPKEKAPHEKVTPERLRTLIGGEMADRLFDKARCRIEGRIIPECPKLEKEIEAFLNGSLANIVIVHSCTLRGDVFIELVSE